MEASSRLLLLRPLSRDCTQHPSLLQVPLCVCRFQYHARAHTSTAVTSSHLNKLMGLLSALPYCSKYFGAPSKIILKNSINVHPTLYYMYKIREHPCSLRCTPTCTRATEVLPNLFFAVYYLDAYRLATTKNLVYIRNTSRQWLSPSIPARNQRRLLSLVGSFVFEIPSVRVNRKLALVLVPFTK